MPIRPENRKRYPSNWKDLTASIRERAGNACEGSPAYPDCRAPNHQPHPITGSRVVLTVAHLDHDPRNNDPANLRAWCQKCHNTYDAPHRALNRAARLNASPCICGGTGRVLIDDDAEVHCPHCPAPSNVAQDTDEISRFRVGLL